jgi:SAM-dependent methyltransferase
VPAAIQWEWIPCPLCGSSSALPLLQTPAGSGEGIDAYHLQQCQDCRLVYLNPRPTRDSIGHYYPPEYQPYLPKQHEKTLQRISWARWLGRADPHSYLPLKPPGRLLDYGCGSGAFLQSMRSLGWDVVGVDISPHAVRATQQRGIPAFQGTLPHPAVPLGSVDVVNFGAVLEHVHDPHELLAAARATVRPGGLVVFSVPNFASWGARWFGPAWWPLELPRHLLHFTPQTIDRLVRDHDLEMLELRMPAHTNWMRLSIARARQQIPRDSRLKRLLLALWRRRPFTSWLTRWTTWRGQGDGLLLVTRRPATKALFSQQAA